MIRHAVHPSVLLAPLAALALGCGDSPQLREPVGGADDAASPEADAGPEVHAEARPDSVRAVYVPDYSHIYHGSGRDRFPLTTTLSVRNTDPERTIALLSVRYYDTSGELTRRFLEAPRRLGPLGTADFVVAEHDVSGGTGANFIVEWTASRPVSRPLIESVMIGTRGNQGVSFTSRGRPIERRRP